MEERRGFEEYEDGTVVYDILGEPFEVTKELDAGLKWENFALEKKKQAESQGKQVYRQLGSFDALFTRLPAMLLEWRDQMLDSAVEALMTNGIYDYDRKRLMKRCLQEDGTVYVSVFGEHLGDVLGHIIEQPDYQIRELTEMKEYIERSEYGKRKALSAEVYGYEEIKNAVVISYIAPCMVINAVVTKLLKQERIIKSLDYQDDKADAIYENCKRSGNLSQEQYRKLLLQAFLADPRNASVIEMALHLGLDNSGGLAEFANRYGISKSADSKQPTNQFKLTDNDIIKNLCQQFLQAHNASQFKCSQKLKSALGIENMDDEDIYLARDDTLLHTGKNGFAITKDGIYCRDVSSKVTHINFDVLTRAKKITSKLTGSIYADKTIIAQSTESAKDLVKLFTSIAGVVR